VLSYAQYVGPEFFSTLRIPLLQGRAFTSGDEGDAPPVVIINEFFAQELWPDQNAIGKRLVMGRKAPDQPWNTVVGVVPDVQPRIRPDSMPLHQIYYPVMQGGEWSRCLMVKTAIEPTAVFGPLRAAVRGVSPNLAVFSISTMEQLLSNARSQTRFIAFLMGAFALLALCLAVVGVYGVVSYSVSQASHEIGIRFALGAQSRDELGLFMKRASILMAVGLVLGLGASLATTRFLTGILYEVSPLDGSVFVLISVALAFIVGLASYLPARRASRLDPIAALHYE
jgi:putative ABC transport system permease protein